MAYFPVTCPRTGDILYVDISAEVEHGTFESIDVEDVVYENDLHETLLNQLKGHTFFDSQHLSDVLIDIFAISREMCPDLFEKLCADVFDPKNEEVAA
jgi:hypothetical protein